MTVIAYGTVAVLLAALALAAHRRPGTRHRAVADDAWLQFRPLILRLPPALLAGSFLAMLIPEEQVVTLLGKQSGFPGILLASAVGAILPGGPMIAFPIALALMEAGVGAAQMVSILTAWSILALHRVLVFEVPMMGWPFAVQRLLVSLPLPVAAGVLTELLLALLPG